MGGQNAKCTQHRVGEWFNFRHWKTIDCCRGLAQMVDVCQWEREGSL